MTKKLSLLFVLMLSTLTASAKTLIDGIYYNLDTKAKQAEVTYGDSEYTGSVTIPATVTYNDVTYSVTSIGGGAFQVPWYSGLTSVKIPNSVTSIGEYAFEGCSGLTSMTIPNSVTSIGNGAFSGCFGLTELTIPNSVTSIGEGTFSGCTSLTSLTIPNSVTSIGSEAFSGCFGLTSISVENGNEEYDSRDNCNAIIETASNTLIAGCKNTVIPNSVTSIGSSAFVFCSFLTSITIPNSVTSIGKYAFQSCSNLKSVKSEILVPFTFGSDAFSNISSNCVLVVPYGTKDAYIAKGWTTSVFKGGVKEDKPIVDGIYYDFNSDTKQATVASGEKKYSGNVIIPSSVTFNDTEYSVTSIGESAFWGCSGLTSVTIPNSVTSIGNNAFAVCSGLTSITIGNSVTSIGGSAFSDCPGLTSITIPNSVTSIGNWAFSRCYFAKKDFINNSSLNAEANNYWGANIVDSRNDGFVIKDGTLLKYIGNDVSVTIPNSVTSIGHYAFCDCSKLTYVTIPNSVTSIGFFAFANCSSLTSVTIGSGVTSIGGWSFDEADISSVVSLIENPFKIYGQTLYNRTFSQNTFNNATLYVPKGAIEKYKATDGWKDFSNIVELPEVLRGDANGDGKVDMDDATFVTNIILGTEEATEAADVNKDGEINMPDAMFIVNKILNGKFPDE